MVSPIFSGRATLYEWEVAEDTLISWVGGAITVTPRFPNNVNNTNNQSFQRKTGYHTTFKL